MINKIESERRRVLRTVKATIKHYGMAVMAIGDGPHSFHYTVGRAARGLPELLIAVPLVPEQGKALLNELDRLMPEPQPNGLVDLGGQFPVLVIEATDPKTWDEYTLLAGTIHGSDAYRVQQVVFCDREGRFPPDPACAAPYSKQPLLGDY